MCITDFVDMEKKTAWITGFLKILGAQLGESMGILELAGIEARVESTS